MAFTPNSTVYLLDTPLDNTYKNQIYFANTTSQYEYFFSKRKHTIDDVTYLRKDNSMTINRNIDILWDCNYVMYRNDNFNNKWFYAFITKMEWVSANATRIYIETDVYQTWLTECQLKDSFVVREHVMDDSKGLNLLEEGLDYGDYKLYQYTKTDLMNDISFVVAVSEDLSGGTVGGVYGHVYSGLKYVVFPESASGGMTDFLNNYVSGGKGDAIQFIFTIPSAFLDVTQGDIPTGTTSNQLTYMYNPTINSIDGYIPENNKLYNFPYNFLDVSNNQGGHAVYKFEDFFEGNLVFKLISPISPNPNVMIVPTNYKGRPTLVYEEGLSMGQYPLCSWNNDTYGAWLAQNSTAITYGLGSGAVQILGGIATRNPIPISMGVDSIKNQMMEIRRASIQPDQARGNINGATLNLSLGTQDFYFKHMTIKKEYAKRIDQFFTMFGYKINTVKVPNTHGRPCWNYVETIDVSIDGAIPTEDMQRLKRMYNEGVTLWKSGSYVGNYSLNNKIGG